MSGFRGHGQDKRTGVAKGPISQRKLVNILSILIDTSRGKAASKTRDDARQALRDLLVVANWMTPYVMRNIGSRRCRYLSGLDYPVPIEYVIPTGLERLERLDARRGI